jgi:hypothetical protein
MSEPPMLTTIDSAAAGAGCIVFEDDSVLWRMESAMSAPLTVGSSAAVLSPIAVCVSAKDIVGSNVNGEGSCSVIAVGGDAGNTVVGLLPTPLSDTESR